MELKGNLRFLSSRDYLLSLGRMDVLKDKSKKVKNIVKSSQSFRTKTKGMMFKYKIRLNIKKIP